jgi:hypothetical protein
MTGSKSTGRHGKKYPYYHHHKQTCDHAKFIPKESFEQMFVEYLHEINPSVAYEKLFKVIVLDIWKNNYKKYDDQNERVRGEMKTLEAQRQKVFDMHRDGVYSNTEFLEQKDLISKKISEKSLMIKNTTDKSFDMDAALTYCFSFVRDTAGWWLKYTGHIE